jgi:tight adherence protein C
MFSTLLAPADFSAELVMALFWGFACLLLLSGAVGFYATRDRSAVRLRAISDQMYGTPLSLSKKHARDPRGWMKALVPEDPTERAQIRFQLAKVGFDRANSVELFFLVRLMLALFAPAMVLLIVGLNRADMLPPGLSDTISTTSTLRFLQIAAIGTGIGFYGPGYWLKGRINARKLKISQAFPNALDLVQISVEAGLGFDAAMQKVGQELGRAAPEVAYELVLLQMEIQAGRDREAALFDMADRMGIEEAKSFAVVIVQSLQFGTSLTSALKTYAADMRRMRELEAQEKANKLPVQMSGVMSVLMLPALFLITLTPIIIRFMALD